MKAKSPVQRNAVVSVVMGSDSDLPVMTEAVKILEAFAIPHELFLTSAHRTPERTAKFAEAAAKRGVKIIIVGAGAPLIWPASSPHKHSCLWSGCRSMPRPFMVWMLCWQPCRCPAVYRLPPWR